MKKVVFALLMVTLLAGGAFAQDKLLSAGIGLKGAYYIDTYDWEIKYPSISYSGSESNESSAFGLNAFFDVKFAEVNLDLIWQEDVLGIQWNYLGLGVVGKFPIAIGDKFAIYPFAGIDYLILMGATYKGNEYTLKNKSDYARLYITFGLGFDFNLSDTLYLRAEAGYGIGFDTKAEKDNDDANTKLVKAYNGSVDIKRTHGQVPYKICVGYRF